MKTQKKISAQQTKKFAAEIIEMKLGLKVTPSDLIIVDAETSFEDHGGDEQEVVRSIDFYRRGFPNINYTVSFRYHEWKLLIIDARTEKELLIP